MNVMTPVAASVNDDPPSIETLLDRARALRPMLMERAAATEADRRVSAEVTRILVEAGLYRLGQPKRFGGYEYGPSDLLRLGFEIGRGCGSTGWCAMIANVNAWLAAYWPLRAQEEIWGDNADHLVTGTFVPTGNCDAANGGYRVWGRWPFSSNCDNSDWLFVSALLPAAEGQAPSVGWFMVPRADVGIDQASWHVAGMQGTGSKTLLAETPIFVPEHRVIRFADVERGTTPGRDVPDNVMARFNFATMGAVTLVAPLLGTAQAALDWYGEAMRTKAKASLKPGAPMSVAQNPQAQARAGEAQARIDAALALLLADLAPVEAKVRAGEEPDVADRIRIRRDIGFSARQAADAVNLLFEGAGAASAALDAPIQRYWRDINAAARHASLDTQAIYALVGQQVFGLDPKGQF
ncbi:acyl-CoA dehydrogenase family protein [Sphingomonas oryzagri]|uniref:Acyl-CoA dehydrogenase n=1 Tax=Sphingomonas oryzagri TaxID=3042314 RepID=A0ABT6N155_9SPHN|nr:acyl-CoA dehydrogenase family protein [Sphingomonas oryzagri]MDH7639029.1 acyl-CoA dehydrogenase [Sphingomonas oryzagri]